MTMNIRISDVRDAQAVAKAVQAALNQLITAEAILAAKNHSGRLRSISIYPPHWTQSGREIAVIDFSIPPTFPSRAPSATVALYFVAPRFQGDMYVGEAVWKRISLQAPGAHPAQCRLAYKARYAEAQLYVPVSTMLQSDKPVTVVLGEE